MLVCSQMQPSPLLQSREQSTLRQLDPLVCWARQCPTRDLVAAASSKVCCRRLAATRGLFPGHVL